MVSDAERWVKGWCVPTRWRAFSIHSTSPGFAHETGQLGQLEDMVLTRAEYTELT